MTGDMVFAVHRKIQYFHVVSCIYSKCFFVLPPLICRHNGEVPSTRPKSDFEPLLPTKPKTLSGDWGEKSSDTGMYSVPYRQCQTMVRILKNGVISFA